jgi:hypothetical protein
MGTDADDTANQANATDAGGGLAEAQIAAIEAAFAEHDRMISRLRRELEDLQGERRGESEDALADEIAGRLEAIEIKLDRHDQALRHMLQRLIEFFELERPRQP